MDLKRGKEIAGSSDEDGRVVEYQWQMLKGQTVQLPAMNTGVLKLDLVPGTYNFKWVKGEARDCWGSKQMNMRSHLARGLLETRGVRERRGK
jgi:hypothetical protein